MSNHKQILVVNLAGIGDIVTSSAAIKTLKETFTDSRICLLTFWDNAELVVLCPYLHQTFFFHKKSNGRNLKTLGVLRSLKFDAAINLYNIHSWAGALKMWFLFSIIGVQETFGRDTDAKGFFFKHKIQETFPPGKHDSEVMLDVIGMLGAKASAINPELWVGDQSHGIENFFHKHCILDSDQIACIHPGATREDHRWDIDYFSKVADELAARYGFKIIMTGSAQEKVLAALMAKKMKAPAIIAAGEFTLTDLVACLKRCKIFITNDTGPMHLANVFNVPLVVVSGKSPTAFLPFKKDKTMILRNSSQRHHFSCLNAIGPLEVIRAAESLLGTKEFSKTEMGKKDLVKVLHLHTRAVVGGSATNALLTLAGLPKDRFCGHLACGIKEAQQPFCNCVKSKQIALHFIPHLCNRIHPLYDLLAFFEIVRLIKKEKYTIVHTHNSKAGILGRLAAKVCGVKVIIHTIHSCVFHYDDISGFVKKFFMAIEKAVVPFTDGFIAISRHIQDEYDKHRIVAKEKIRVIYSGIETKEFQQSVDRDLKRKELGLRQGDTTVGIVARLEKGKGHDDIIRAIPEVLAKGKNVSFVFVGDGPLRYRLENMSKATGIHDHVVFLGLRSDVAEILKTMDVFCLPSVYEGMGRVVLEAQAAGVPVVATDKGGIPDIVRKNKTAILVPAKDYRSLSQAILKLVENPQLRQDMGRAAENFVDERFSAQTMVQEIVRYYDDLLKENDKCLMSNDK